jgi:hypothetical protein
MVAKVHDLVDAIGRNIGEYGVKRESISDAMVASLIERALERWGGRCRSSPTRGRSREWNRPNRHPQSVLTRRRKQYPLKLSQGRALAVEAGWQKVLTLEANECSIERESGANPAAHRW